MFVSTVIEIDFI